MWKVALLSTLLLASCGQPVSPGDMKNAPQVATPASEPTGPTTCINGVTYESVPWGDSKFLVMKNGVGVPCK